MYQSLLQPVSSRLCSSLKNFYTDHSTNSISKFFRYDLLRTTFALSPALSVVLLRTDSLQHPSLSICKQSASRGRESRDQLGQIAYAPKIPAWHSDSHVPESPTSESGRDTRPSRLPPSPGAMLCRRPESTQDRPAADPLHLPQTAGPRPDSPPPECPADSEHPPTPPKRTSPPKLKNLPVLGTGRFPGGVC